MMRVNYSSSEKNYSTLGKDDFSSHTMVGDRWKIK